jgi:hypothetical protein
MWKQLKVELQELVASGNIHLALKKLKNLINKELEQYNTLIMLSNQLKFSTKRFENGLLGMEAFQVEQNRITKSFLEMLSEISDKDFHFSSDFDDAIYSLPLRRLGKLHLVNCDRQPLFTSFRNFFRTKSNLKYHYYFIVGCPTQKPLSFAERIIYDIIDEVLLNDEDSLNYERWETCLQNGTVDTLVERLKHEPLPKGMDAEKSMLKLKKYLDQRFNDYLGDKATIDDFLAFKAPLLPFKYIACVFDIDVEEWDEETAKYLNNLMTVFSSNTLEKPIFLFFFVVKLSKAHEQPSHGIFKQLDALINTSPKACLLLKDMTPVPEPDVERWFLNATNNANPGKIQAIIQDFKKSLFQHNRKILDGQFDMMDVEELQEKVWLHAVKNSGNRI